MGVPAFFAWIAQNCKNCVKELWTKPSKWKEYLEAMESLEQDKRKKTKRQNKRRGYKLRQVDNLYIDLNGMIHPCCHPQFGVIPADEDEMMMNLLEYLDWIIDIVKPRKLIYFAVDGVCPRAKMNQQRGRRFSAAKTRAKQTSLGKVGPWDYNQITPGTEFMEIVSKALRYYIKRKVSTEVEHVRMIFSDSHCPGEGEHKIMSFIRHLRHDQNYDPKTRHVLYGADADLIFLALTVHEPNFFIIRETPEGPKQAKPSSLTEQRFTAVSIGTLRKHLYRKFKILKDIPCGFDFERVLDDFVFLCVLGGNDFIPHLPHLDIRYGAVDILLKVYFSAAKKFSDYLVNNGRVQINSLVIYLKTFTRIERDLLTGKAGSRRMKRRKGHQWKTLRDMKIELAAPSAKRRKGLDGKPIATEDDGALGDEASDSGEEKEDLWLMGFKERYYSIKMSIKDKESIEKLAREYIKGLCWVTEYYFLGVPSWDWFYPRHYAPFASDMTKLKDATITFEKDEPKSPLFQLMAVMPLGSSQFLPPGLQKLMHSEEMAPFYPSSFKIDKNHKKFDWEGIVKIPFLISGKLDEALLSNLDPLLTEAEKARNVNMDPIIIANEKLFPTKGTTSDLKFGLALPGTVAELEGTEQTITKLSCSFGQPGWSDEVKNTSKVASYKLPDHYPKHLCKLLTGAVDESPEVDKEDDDVRPKPRPKVSLKLERVRTQLRGRKRKGAPVKSLETKTSPEEDVELTPKKRKKQQMKKWVLSNNPFAALADFY